MYQAQPIVTDILNGRLVQRAGCIRLGQNNVYGAPYWHINAAHRTAGFQLFDSLENPVVELNSSDRIVVRGTFVANGEEVLSINPNVDETMAKMGVFAAGASGGGTLMSISLYKNRLINGVLTVEEVSPRSTSNFPNDFANIWLTVTSWVPQA